MSLKRKLKAEDGGDAVSFLDESESDHEDQSECEKPEDKELVQPPPTKKRKTHATKNEQTESKTEHFADVNGTDVVDSAALGEDNPFSKEEIEGEFEEDEFMDKLSKHLEQKYDDAEDMKNDDVKTKDDDVKQNEPKHAQPLNAEEITAYDILTMDEDQLEKIMPVADAEVEAHFNPMRHKIAERKKKMKPSKKRKKNRAYHRKRNIGYGTVPTRNKTATTDTTDKTDTTDTTGTTTT